VVELEAVSVCDVLVSVYVKVTVVLVLVVAKISK